MTAAPEKNLARVLRALFIAQARDVLQRVRLDGDAPSLSKWGPILADAARPYLEQAWRQGMLQGARRLQSVQQGKTGEAVPLLEHLQPTEQGTSVGGPVPTWHPTLRFGAEEARSKSTGRVSVLVVDYRRHGYYRKALRRIHSKALGWGFDLYNTRINDAVDAAVLAFCRSTNETASGSLEEALVKLRAELKEGLSQGEAHTALARRVRTIFADPFRSWRIAVTETSRAVHLGAVMSYKDSGMVEKRRWLASSDACPDCLALNGKEVSLEEPYLVKPGGGPYAVVMSPPLHPSCFCDEVPVL